MRAAARGARGACSTHTHCTQSPHARFFFLSSFLSGAYYYAPARSPSYANVWVVYLGGRDWCYDYSSCAQRHRYSPEQMSSQEWPQHITLSGLFSPDPSKNPFAGANKVFVGYCSSDAWTGDIGASAATFGYAFRGQRVLRAVLAALVAQHGLGSSHLRGDGAPDRLLLAGGAAGGRGALLTIDSVLSWLAAAGTTAGAVTVQGLFDAALWVPLQPLSSGGASTTLQYQSQRAIGLFNASALMSAACLAAYPASTQQWQCFFPSYRLPFVQSSYVLSQPLYDKRQLPYDMGGAMPPYNAAQLSYADTFAAAVAKVASGVTAGASSSNAVFTPACFKAVVSLSPQFWGVRAAAASAGGAAKSLADVLHAWFFLSQPSASAVDTCSGFACGGACRRHAPKARTAPKPTRVTNTTADDGLPGQMLANDAAVAPVSGITARTLDRRGSYKHSARQRSLVFVALLLAVGVTVACLLAALMPSRTEVRGLSAAEARRAASEGTPLRAVAHSGGSLAQREQLQRWAEQEAEANRRRAGMTRGQIVTRFYDGGQVS